MNKEFVLNIIKECESWDEGKSVSFKYTNFHGIKWELIFRKEEKEYLPFKYSISGRRLGTHETIGRRYVDAESAFLHVFNCFNECATVNDRYDSIKEVLEKM